MRRFKSAVRMRNSNVLFTGVVHMCSSKMNFKCVVLIHFEIPSHAIILDKWDSHIWLSQMVIAVVTCDKIQDKAITYELQVRKRPSTLTYCDVFIVVIISILYLCFVLLCRVFCILCVCTFPVIIMYCVLCVSFHFFSSSAVW